MLRVYLSMTSHSLTFFIFIYKCSHKTLYIEAVMFYNVIKSDAL